jgi:aldose 1-epimerase
MITKQLFGEINSQQIYKFTLTNNNGMSVVLSNFGATIISINTPDKNGKIVDVIGGYDTLESYIEADGYQGAIIGRVGNRICEGKFTLDGIDYNLYINNGPNHLHGGKIGYDKRVWNVLSTNDSDEPSIKFFLLANDGEEGYPGNLSITITYSLSNEGALSIRYEATTDKKTIINLTNHTYFNLGGCDSGKIHDHILWLDADTYLPTDDSLIPTGEIRSVEGTPFDFRLSKKIGRDINLQNNDLVIAGGYDHCLNFAGGETGFPKLRAKVIHEASGRIMEMYTNQPCVQFYSGNFLGNEKYPFKNNCVQNKQIAFCLETQHMPDAINHDNFTSVILNPEEKYDYTTIYKFYC